MRVEEAVKLAIEALKSGEKDVATKDIEISVITQTEFKRLSEAEIAKYVS